MFIPNYVFYEYAVLHATYAYASSWYLSVILSFFIANTATAFLGYFTRCRLKRQPQLLHVHMFGICAISLLLI